VLKRATQIVALAMTGALALTTSALAGDSSYFCAYRFADNPRLPRSCEYSPTTGYGPASGSFDTHTTDANVRFEPDGRFSVTARGKGSGGGAVIWGWGPLGLPGSLIQGAGILSSSADVSVSALKSRHASVEFGVAVQLYNAGIRRMTLSGKWELERGANPSYGFAHETQEGDSADISGYLLVTPTGKRAAVEVAGRLNWLSATYEPPGSQEGS
jgi:hypothetical protein